MSYAKAMKHARNVRKVRAQSRMYFGFDTGTGRWPSGYSNPVTAALLHIRDWFPLRNRGSNEHGLQYRTAIREQIEIYRKGIS